MGNIKKFEVVMMGIFMIFLQGCQVVNTNMNADFLGSFDDAGGGELIKNEELIINNKPAAAGSFALQNFYGGHIGALAWPLSSAYQQAMMDILPENFAFGGITSANGVESFLKKISYADKYEQVVVLCSKGSMFEGNSWRDGILPLLRQKFGKAKIIPLSVEKDVGSMDADTFAYYLKSNFLNFSEKSLVIALAEFDEPSYEFAAEFENAFTNTVLTNMDSDKFDELLTRDYQVLSVLAYYLSSMSAGKTLDIQKTEKSWQVIYGRGRRLNQDRTYVIFFGDIMLGRAVRSLMNKNGLEYPFAKVDENYLRGNDILLGNLEGPIAKKAIQTKKTIAFRFMPDVAPLLKDYYFDVLSLANNHAYDMGQKGYDSSNELLDAEGILHFGDARGVNGDSVARVTVRGQKIAFLGLEEVVYKINDEAAVKTVKDLVAEDYLVIPFVHMGVEYQHKPNARQKDFYHKLIDAGALMVIGHHPHVVQGFEIYKGKYIYYSLGNAVFDQYFSKDTQEGLSLAVVIGGDVTGESGSSASSVLVYPIPFRIEKSQIRLMDKEEREEFFKRFEKW